MDLTLDVRPLSPVLVEDIPAGARVTLTDEDIARIRRLAGIVQALERIYGMVYGIELWDASPRWMAGTEEDGPESEYNMEVVTLHITERELYWTGCPKHSDTWVETVPVLIEDLQVPERPEATAQVAV